MNRRLQNALPAVVYPAGQINRRRGMFLQLSENVKYGRKAI